MFTLTSTNLGREKEYGAVYQEFIDKVILPESYIDRMYTSKGKNGVEAIGRKLMSVLDDVTYHSEVVS